MSELSQRDREHLFESLRKGLVPERGVEAIAVGTEKPAAELQRQLELVKAGEGSVKFLRGGYGCGKTFTARLGAHRARLAGFATSFVVVSDNDLQFHRFDEVYRKVMAELGTASCPRGALPDLLDRWVGKAEDALISGGADPDAPGFDALVEKRLQEELLRGTRQQAPADFVRVVQTVFQLKQQGEVADAGALLSWLSGSVNVASAAKKRAGIKGDIGSADALAYLRGVVAIVRQSGYHGLMIVIDEAETILRMRSDSRHKSLNGIRQITDAAASVPGLLWVFTGTPEFFDSRRGVAGLQPLHERVAFQDGGKFTSLKQMQLQLSPFDADRLRRVAERLRDLYPAADPARLRRALPDEFLDRLIHEVTAGFRGDVGVVPRQFLRQLVGEMDKVEEHPEYVPADEYAFQLPDTLTAEEQRAATGVREPPPGEDADLVAVQDAW